MTRTRDEQQIQNYQETVRGCCVGYIESPDKRCVPFCAKSCAMAIVHFRTLALAMKGIHQKQINRMSK